MPENSPVDELGHYEVVRQRAGFHSIRDKVSGETMHSTIDPIIEAQLLYVGQSDLRLQLFKDLAEPLVIWDVGLGAATNAMAAVGEVESLKKESGGMRQVQIISFENDLDSLRLAMKNPSRFSQTRHPAPLEILDKGTWKDDGLGIEWMLQAGDFAANFSKSPAPDIIYYDMYSVKFNDLLWSLDLFRNIFAHCQGRPARLITYTVSTRIRAVLLAAGFWVCYGAQSGPKDDTTLAFTSPEEARDHPKLMGREWLGKWKRSTAQTGEHLPEEEKEYIRHRVIHHEQFQNHLDGEHSGHG